MLGELVSSVFKEITEGLDNPRLLGGLFGPAASGVLVPVRASAQPTRQPPAPTGPR